jgi:hypothetical protein
MIENCASYTQTWFYSIQTYCSMPSTLEFTWLGRISIGILLILIAMWLRKFIPLASSEVQ